MSQRRRFRSRAARLAPALAAAFVALAASARAQKLQVQYTGGDSGEYFGASISSGFDCDGDGVDDIAIGAPYETPLGGWLGQGVVRVYSGATQLLLRDFTVPAVDAFTGYAVALVGDMDGDGLSDLVFGAPGYGSNAGYVAAWNVATGQQIWSVDGTGAESLGTSIAAAGDVDHDGLMDVIVGAANGNNVYLLAADSSVLHSWNFAQTGAAFGFAVAGNVDVDGDGTNDVIVGTPDYDTTFPLKVADRGRVDVYSGVTANQIWGSIGDHAGDNLGWSVAGIGDVNGDGRSEVVAGAPSYDSASYSSCGLVRKFDGTGAKLSDLIGNSQGQALGFSLASVPDLDGDGFREYLAGAPWAGGGGAAELHSGSDDALLWNFTPPDSSYVEYGFSVTGGDLNGDGMGDVAISDPHRASWAADVGGVDVWLDFEATAANYGSGYPGTLGVPDLSALNLPGLGETFTAGITNSRGVTTTGLLLVGFSRLNVPTSAGGTLLVAPFLVLPVSIPPTGLLLSGAIPSDRSLLGVKVDLQVLEFDPGASRKLSFTDGLELSLGIDYP